MSVELLKSIFDWATVILIALRITSKHWPEISRSLCRLRLSPCPSVVIARVLRFLFTLACTAYDAASPLASGCCSFACMHFYLR